MEIEWNAPSLSSKGRIALELIVCAWTEIHCDGRTRHVRLLTPQITMPIYAAEDKTQLTQDNPGESYLERPRPSALRIIDARKRKMAGVVIQKKMTFLFIMKLKCLNIILYSWNVWYDQHIDQNLLKLSYKP